MAMTAEVDRKELEVSVKYGIVGAGCNARMTRVEAAGMTARQLVEHVLRQQPSNGANHWIGRVLDEVIRSDREIDVELSHGPGSGLAGDPIGLQEMVVIPSLEKQTAHPSKLTVSLSESYRGGNRNKMSSTCALRK